MSRRLALLAVALLTVTACGPAAAPPGSPSPSGSPAPTGSPPPGSIEHPTGPTEVVLRYEVGGGFVPVEWLATNVPVFSLYGDGTIVLRDPADQPGADNNGLLRYQPMRVARLSEDQLQALLDFAITAGGLGVARARYDNPMMADAPTTTFTLQAGGRTKVVEIYGLFEGDEGPDAVARRNFLALANRLSNFDDDGAYPTAPYEPTAYRAILLETQNVIVPLVAWPWTTIEPSDFPTPKDPNAPLQFAQRVLTPAEVEAIGLGELLGGAQGIYLTASDGKQYSLSLRPLLPGETA